MSCSSVNIKGNGPITTTTPAGPPLLIANLDPIRRDCFTYEDTSVIYPAKYIGLSIFEEAQIALGLQNLPVPDPNSCGSDNFTLLELLKGHESLSPTPQHISISKVSPTCNQMFQAHQTSKSQANTTFQINTVLQKNRTSQVSTTWTTTTVTTTIFEAITSHTLRLSMSPKSTRKTLCVKPTSSYRRIMC